MDGRAGTKAENPVRETAEHWLFSFLTCPANDVVGPEHPKVMAVLLTTPGEWTKWLEALTAEALTLQRPLLDAAMREAARGARADGL